MRVFISYQREQDGFGAVAQLRARLQNELKLRDRSATVFTDINDLKPGDNFPDELREQLEEADVFVACLSSGWLQSEWCRRELMIFTGNLAHATKKLRVVPLLWVRTPELEDGKSDEPIEKFLAVLNYDDWREHRFEDPASPVYAKHAARLADTLIDRSRMVAKESPPVPAAPIEVVAAVVPAPEIETVAQPPVATHSPAPEVAASALDEATASSPEVAPAPPQAAAGMMPERMHEPLRRALFQDAPIIIDNFWRWCEFQVNRLGEVHWEGEQRYILRPAWLSIPFLMFVLLSILTVFGPTWDAFCSMQGVGAVDASFISNVFLISAPLLFMLVWNALAGPVARRADSLAAIDPRGFPDASGASAASGEQLLSTAGLLRVLFRRILNALAGNLHRLVSTLPRLPRRDAYALLMLLTVLATGAMLMVSPLLSIGIGLRLQDADPLTCMSSGNAGLVVAQFIVLACLVLAGLLLWRGLGSRRPFLTCVASALLLFAATSVLWFAFMPTRPSEALGGFYPHVFLIIVGAFLGVAIVARLLAHIFFSGAGRATEYFRNAAASADLIRNELLVPQVSNLGLMSALIGGVTGNLMHFLLLPSFAAILAPTDTLWVTVPLFVIISQLLLTYCSITPRRAQLLIAVERWFLLGTPRVISTAIIVLAVARLLGVQYVSMLLDVVPVRVSVTFLVMTYVVVWFFEYWINRWAGERLLGLLADSTSAREGFVPCAFDAGAMLPWANAPDRVIALHGPGRFIAHGWFERRYPMAGERKREQAFTTYGLVELFDVLGSREPIGELHAQDVSRRVSLYFAMVNMLLMVVLTIILVWHLDWSRPLSIDPIVHASATSPGLSGSTALRQAARQPGDRLASRLLAQASEGRPSLVIAASGGGMRASIYTAVALEGLGRIDRARDIVMLSGGSGGGISAAVFASRLESLRASNPADEPPDGAWSRFIRAASQPYIQDVFEGAGELRIAGGASLAVLMQESLERRAFAADMTNVDTFGELGPAALILNTAIGGHPYSDSELLQGRVAAPGRSCDSQARPYANLSGGRLVFTNLDNLSGFPNPSVDGPDMWFPYRVVTDGDVKLAAASALTANFAPIFSNARVRLITRDSADCPAQSYFVTDGGATEDLALASALYALRGTLSQLDAERLSDVHVLVFEATAINYDYVNDRGLQAETGGTKVRATAGLTQALIKEVGSLMEMRGAALRVHYLPLPVAFRSRGDFGTRWMYARNISVANPLLPQMPTLSAELLSASSFVDHVGLNPSEVLVSWRALFDTMEPICSRAEYYHASPSARPPGWTPNVQIVARWLCGHDDQRASRALLPDYQVEAWSAVVRELGRSN
jgi:hypothetical protein